MNFDFPSLLKKIVKFEFSQPTPKKILIYDASHYSLLKKFFKNYIFFTIFILNISFLLRKNLMRWITKTLQS